jgi:hypothetical protein
MTSWTTYSALGWALFWTGVAATLGAGALWAIAIRGRVTDWNPACGRCRFRLHTVPPALRTCPECGASLELPGAIVPAARRRSGGAFGAAFLLSAVAALAFIGNHPSTLPRLKAWWRTQQSHASLLAAAFEDPEDSWHELNSRLAAGALTDEQIDQTLEFAMNAAITKPNTLADFHDANIFIRTMTQQSRWTPARRHALLNFLVDHGGVAVTGAGTLLPGKSIALVVVVNSNLDPSNAAAGFSNGAWPGTRMRVESVRVGPAGGPMRSVEKFSVGTAPPGPYATVAFFAPDEPGRYLAEITATLAEANDAAAPGHFSRTIVVPWPFQVRDPAATTMSFHADPPLAERVKQWLAGSRIDWDSPARAAVVQLPAYPEGLLPPELHLSYRLRVSQGGKAVDAGSLWMSSPFTAGYKGQMPSFVVPSEWDTKQPVTLTFEPDPELALRRGARDGEALLNAIEIPGLVLLASDAAAAPHE